MTAEKTPRILLISYLFPPSGGVAVQRMLSMAKYLPGQGFVVHVLRARNAATPVIDRGLLQHIPPSVTVHHAITPEPPFALRQKAWSWLSPKKKSAAEPGARAVTKGGWRSAITDAVRRMLCPEPEVLWVPFALRKARRIIRRHAIDSVLVTAPPFSAFLVGIALKREFPHLKLISDFRDSWLDFYLANIDFQKNDRTRKRAEEIERLTVELSDFVVTVTSSIRDEIRLRYPEQAGEKFICIPNGYDPAALAGFQMARQRRPDDKIVVGHLGTVYGASSPRFFLDALDAMPEHVRSAFEVRFIGRIAEGEGTALALRKSNVQVLGFMPQARALADMENADYCLVVMTDGASVTGKIYEYLAMGRPILAVAPVDGEVARVLRETGAGWCVDPADHKGLQAMIQQAYDDARKGTSCLHRNVAAIQRYERPRLVAEYGRLFQARTREETAVEVMQ